MSTHYTFYTEVRPFYQSLERSLQQAQHTIHMAYYAFDDGRWAQRIGRILKQKAAEGVAVKLMVDEAGIYLDNAGNSLNNRRLLESLSTADVQIDIFRPVGRRLGRFNRLHCKFCAIDQHTAFVGGSNIGDHYLDWRDSNLRLRGDLGLAFANLYQTLHYFSRGTGSRHLPEASLQMAGVPLLMTVPGHRQDIRRALLELILEAKEAVYLRSWYFLPDREIANALLTQAERGVRVSVLFSHRTRVPFIDLANRSLAARLSRSGVQIYRYTGRYMHAKEAWNDRGDILIGSANIDRWALRTCFECCLHIRSDELARQLTTVLRREARAFCQPGRKSQTWHYQPQMIECRRSVVSGWI
jgi:cardiolipin synthase